MADPIISGFLFSTIILLLSVYKPNICRVSLGLFFIVLALGVHIPLFISQPFFVYESGMGAWIPFFRMLTETIIGLNPRLFGVFLIILEVLIGLLLMAKGVWAKIGIISSSILILMSVPLDYSQIAWAVSLVGILFLMRLKYTLDVFGKIADFADRFRSR
jgi:hypothetical protein